MDHIKITLRVPKSLFDEVTNFAKNHSDITGYTHISMNTWIILALKEKVDRLGNLEQSRDQHD